MNLICIRHFSNFAKKILVNNCQYKDRERLLLLNNVKIYVIKRPAVSKPSLYGIRKKETNSIGLYGYALLGIPVISFILGTWQLQRRQWKLKLIEDLKNRMDLEPVDLLENIDQLDDMEYRFVKVRGKFLYEKEFFLGPRSFITHGAPLATGSLLSNRMTSGYNVITPFEVEGQNLTILVNRGWISRNIKNQSYSKPEGTIEINGVVRKQEKQPAFNPPNHPGQGIWCYRDITAMANMVDASPIFIDLWSKKDPPKAPISCQTNITLRNEHFSYMMTWYTLSVCTALMWYQSFKLKIPIF